MGALQGARFESLDNSPMYDAPTGYELWDPVAYRMRLFDVGQSSAIAAECEALAIIADALGKDSDAKLLRSRQAQMTTSISAHMWDDALGVFCNVLFNGTR